MQSARILIPFGISMTGAQLRVMNESATGSDDFLPRDVKEKPTQTPTDMVQAKGGRVIDVRLHRNDYRTQLQMSAAGKAELLQFWFPGWRASVDGVPVETAPAGPQGIVSCDVPFGDHIVEFTYNGWQRRSTGVIISILSAAIGACALGVFRQSRYKGQSFRTAE